MIAATNGGLTLVAFINGGQLYAVQQANALSACQAPVVLDGNGASNPSLSISTFGKAYLAFTAPGPGGHDIRAGYFNQGQWTLVSAPLDANVADDAGAGSGRPQVATAGDGTAIVAWGENGHIYTRRVLGTAPSIAFQQADPPSFAGFSEVSADQPAVGAGGDSSYAAIAFRESPVHRRRPAVARAGQPPAGRPLRRGRRRRRPDNARRRGRKHPGWR